MRGARGAAEGSTPTLWQATVGAAEVLGYFTARNEAEVIVDPTALRDTTRV
jgi:hypothetical protein